MLCHENQVKKELLRGRSLSRQCKGSKKKITSAGVSLPSSFQGGVGMEKVNNWMIQG